MDRRSLASAVDDCPGGDEQLVNAAESWLGDCLGYVAGKTLEARGEADARALELRTGKDCGPRFILRVR